MNYVNAHSSPSQKNEKNENEKNENKQNSRSRGTECIKSPEMLVLGMKGGGGGGGKQNGEEQKGGDPGKKRLGEGTSEFVRWMGPLPSFFVSLFLLSFSFFLFPSDELVLTPHSLVFVS